MDSKDLSNSKKKTNLGLMKIVKQLKRNEIKLIGWLINIPVLQILWEHV